jgi:hypothetical protein
MAGLVLDVRKTFVEQALTFVDESPVAKASATIHAKPLSHDSRVAKPLSTIRYSQHLCRAIANLCRRFTLCIAKPLSTIHALQKVVEQSIFAKPLSSIRSSQNISRRFTLCKSFVDDSRFAKPCRAFALRKTLSTIRHSENLCRAIDLRKTFPDDSSFAKPSSTNHVLQNLCRRFTLCKTSSSNRFAKPLSSNRSSQNLCRRFTLCETLSSNRFSQNI